MHESNSNQHNLNQKFKPISASLEGVCLIVMNFLWFVTILLITVHKSFAILLIYTLAIYRYLRAFCLLCTVSILSMAKIRNPKNFYFVSPFSYLFPSSSCLKMFCSKRSCLMIFHINLKFAFYTSIATLSTTTSKECWECIWSFTWLNWLEVVFLYWFSFVKENTVSFNSKSSFN